MLYLFFSLPKHYKYNVNKSYHWFLVTNQVYTPNDENDYSHFCTLNLKSKAEFDKCLCSSLGVCDGLFLTRNISSTLDFNPSQRISIQKEFIFIPTRYKNKCDLFALDTGSFISEICNSLNLQ